MIFCDEPGAQIHVGIVIDERRIGRDRVAAHRNQAHRLGAAGDDGRRRTAHDPFGGERDRLQPRRTESVDRDRRRRDRHASAQARNARDVQPLLGLRHRAAEDHVVDLGGLDARRATERFGDGGRGEFVGSRRAKGAVWRLADRRSHRRNDDGFLHEFIASRRADPRRRRRPHSLYRRTDDPQRR